MHDTIPDSQYDLGIPVLFSVLPDRWMLLRYLKVCNAYLKGAGAMPLAEVMTQYKYLGLPSFESVCRIRRKLQAKYPELAGNSHVRRVRAKGEKDYRNYAKES